MGGATPGMGQRNDPGVTVSISYNVHPGREEEFEEFLESIQATVEKFPGYRGSRLFRPRRNDTRYRVFMRFDSEAHLKLWTESEERQQLYQQGKQFADLAPWASNVTGTAQIQPLSLVLTPLQHYFRTNVSGIGLLLLGTLIALIFANSPLSDSYDRLWSTIMTIGVGDWSIEATLRHWVNDALMALFFFIVGLEIKREVLIGELRRPRQAALPTAAALGGAIVPALVFLAFNFGGDGQRGWGVPIGTDTAFSLGIISLLGSRVSYHLLVFLTAFAIIDDIVAVLVIAIFYTDDLNLQALALAAIFLGALIFANRAGFQRWPVYAVLGFGVWLAIFESGVHGTIAGVLVAMIVPARSWINPGEFVRRGRLLMDRFEDYGSGHGSTLSNEPQQRTAQAIQQLAVQVETPLTHFQYLLNPWVSYVILPIFAFANAGISLTEGLGGAISDPTAWGVVAGLVIGKPIGVTLFTWLAVRTRLATIAADVAWRHIFGIASLGGIGFTMSLFISELAFGDSPLAHASRVGILIGSFVAGFMGYLILKAVLPPPPEQHSAD